MKTRICSIIIGALFFTLLTTGIIAAYKSQKSISQPVAALDRERLTRLEQRLDGLREQLKIPAMSCAIVKDQKVVWAKGFGYADLENKIPATEHTSYHLASLTKTFASTILMQLVQEGKVKLDDPVSKYGVLLESEGVIRVKHLFSHTSEGNPGERYSYNGNRFAELDKVVQKASGKSFAELLIANILDPLEMSETAPNVPPVSRITSKGAGDQKSDADLRTAVMSLFSAFNSGNVDQIEKYLAVQQNAFSRDGGPLERFVDVDQFRRDLRAGVKVNLQVHDLEAAIYGDTGLTTCFYTQAVTLPNGRVRNDGTIRLSLVWNKQDGSWKLVHAHESALTGSLITAKHQQRFDTVSRSLAQPYALDDKSNIVKSRYPAGFSVSAGLISSVLDMARYDVAIDQNRFLHKETQQMAFTPMVSTKGETLPYGLGWFTQNYRGTRLIWHYGYWNCNSSLILKVPERNITFIAMANTDNLSRPTDLGAGDVTSSPVGLAFLKMFIFPEIFGELPKIDWQAQIPELKEQLKRIADKPYADLFVKELIMQSRINASVGRAADSTRLFKAYGELYAKGLPAELASKTVVAQIARAQDNADQTVEFTLAKQQSLRVFAMGEGQGTEMFDYGWIESAETGKRVWEMKEPDTKHAGGAPKNRLVDTVVNLAPGKYKLRYRADDSHSFDNWNAMPPDINFWGIAVYSN